MNVVELKKFSIFDRIFMTCGVINRGGFFHPGMG